MSERIITERRQSRSLLTVLQDETGSFSAARCFLAGWLLNAAVFTWRHIDNEQLGLVLTFYSAVALPLIVWTAGPRLAQYLAPHVTSATQAVADAAKALAAKIAARRNPEQGYEVSK